MSRRMIRARAAWSLSAGLLLTACGGGGDSGGTTTGPSTPPTVPPSVTVTSGSTSVASGATLALQVQVRDDRGQVVASPSVTWTSSNTGVATVSGTGTVTGILAGQATISASSLGATGSISLTVTPGAPARLSVRTQPAGVNAGLVFTTPAAVEVRDAAGNIVPGTTPVVTVAIGSGGGTLRGTTSVTPQAGVATFTDLIIDGTIGDRTLAFSAAGLTGVSSAAVTVGAGPAAALVIRTQPAGAEAGRALTTPPVVEVRDAFGNVAANASGAVTVSLQGGGTLTGAQSVTPVAGVATFTGLTVGGLVGARTLTFATTGVPSVTSQSFPLAAGAAAALALTRAPAGAGLNGPFTTQPVVEVRDGFGNVVNATTAVTATLASGSGTLTGASVAAVAGVATFSSLGITGTPGARTLSFGASGLTSATTSLTPCDGTRGPVLAASPASRTLRAVRLGSAAVDTVEVTDAAGSCTAIGALTTTIAYTGASGWMTGTAASGPPRVVLTATPGALAIAEYAATVTVSAPGATALALPVSFSVRPAVTVAYGTATQKVNEVVVGGSVRIVATAADELGANLTSTVTYASRSPTVATIAADGTVSPLQTGRAWLVAREPSGAADSIFLNVVRTTGPVLRLDLTGFRFTQSGSIVANVVLDTRGTAVGAGQVVLSWPTTASPPSLVTLTSATATAPLNAVIASDTQAGITRLSFASATPLTGVVPIARVEWQAVNRGTSQLVLRAVDLIDPSGNSLLAVLSALQYPLVIP